ncbi:hypothetical protein HDV05_003726 [Chytridiales sp. JEL 0842]|nr:hypothetical protein HDV05_003726 [Chytridiales sp. JEL 0842]
MTDSNPIVSIHLHSSTAPPSTTVVKDPRVISWEDATSILSHINGVSYMMRAKPLFVANGDNEDEDVFGQVPKEVGESVLDDPAVVSLKKSVFEQPEGSLVLLVKGLGNDAVPIPASFIITENQVTSSNRLTSYINDLTSYIARSHPDARANILSVSSEEPQSSAPFTTPGVARVTLRERHPLVLLPGDVSSKMKNTLSELADGAYESVKNHFAKKFGKKRADVFEEDVQVDKNFMIEMDFVTSLFEALHIQKLKMLKKRSEAGALSDFTTVTLSRVNDIYEAYGPDSPKYKIASEITAEVVSEIVDKFTNIYADAAVEILSVSAGISRVYGDFPHLERRVAKVDLSCPLTAADCVTAFSNCSNHGACTKQTNPHNFNQTCFFCSCFRYNMDDAGNRITKGLNQTVKWAGAKCDKQDIGTHFHLLLWVGVGLALAVVYAVGAIATVGENENEMHGAGAGKHNKSD